MYRFDPLTLHEVTLQETRVSIWNAHHFLQCKCAVIIGFQLCFFPTLLLKRLHLIPYVHSVWQVKNLCLLVIFLYYDSWFLFAFIHSWTHVPTSVMTLPYNTLFSIHFVTHTQIPGSLRQEVLQLQLSAKVSLKGNSSDLWPLPHAYVLLQASDLYYNACCRNPSEPSVHHSWLSPLLSASIFVAVRNTHLPI